MTAEADAGGGGGILPPKPKTTKRQRHKQPNEKNNWLIQHPKIHSMEKRERLYIKEAGLAPTSSKKINNESSSMVDPKLDIMSPEVKFGRLLGGTDARKRHKAVQKLKLYLTARCSAATDDDTGGISELDLMKLWKALWYTLYMADRKPVQDELSKQLAQLIWCLAGTEEEDEYAGQAYLEMMQQEEDEEGGGDDDDDDDDDDYDVTLEEIENTLDRDDDDSDDVDEEDDHEGEDDDEEDEEDKEDEDDDNDVDEENKFDDDLDDSEVRHCRGAHLASLFIRTFFRTVRRDWEKMDKYRVDKFYTLIRLVMHQVYKYMALRHWNFGIVRLFNDAIFDEILSQRPNGVRYHLIDLSIEELAKVSAKAAMPLTEATFLDVLEPYLAMTQTGAKDPTVQARVMERILENFLDNYSVVSDNAIRVREQEEVGGSSANKATKQKKEKTKDDQDKDEDDEEEEKIVILDQVHVGTIADFIFDLASDSATDDQYRKSLYDMHKKYQRRLKKIGTDVDIDGNDEHEFEGVEELEEAETEEEAQESPMILEDEVVEEEEIPKKKAKSSKKRKADDAVNENSESIPTNKSDKKKRKKKKKNKHNNDSDDVNNTDDEEEVVISLSEQKEAKKFEDETHHHQKKNKSKRNTDEDDHDDSVEKRGAKAPGSSTKKVKFGKVNRSKSHQASMRALKTATPPNTQERTPEKGILRNKGKHRAPDLLSKSNRKKAVNYF